MIPTAIWQGILAPMLVFALVVLIVKLIFDAAQAYKNFKDLDNIPFKEKKD